MEVSGEVCDPAHFTQMKVAESVQMWRGDRE